MERLEARRPSKVQVGHDEGEGSGEKVATSQVSSWRVSLNYCSAYVSKCSVLSVETHIHNPDDQAEKRRRAVGPAELSTFRAHMERACLTGNKN